METETTDEQTEIDTSDGGPATQAKLSSPQGVIVDRLDNLLFSDTDSNRVRRVDVGTGVIHTVAGVRHHSGFEVVDGEYYFRSLPDILPPVYESDGGLAGRTKFSYPTGLALDKAGNLYIANSGSTRIRRVDAKTGTTTTVGCTPPETPEIAAEPGKEHAE